MADRHDLVLEAIDQSVGNAKATKPFRILEIGVYDGINAVRIIKHAMNRGRMNVSYYGVDLFEDLTPGKSKEEMSKSKLPPTMKAVADRIRQVTKACWLQKGVSYDVIKANAIRNIPQVDVIFIDGGHSLETIYQDWMAVQPLIHDKTKIVFDDYYHNRDDFGCARLINFLMTDPAYQVITPDQVDIYKSTGLEISCVLVTRVSMYPLNIPNSVRGLPEWSDPPAEKTVPEGEDHGREETTTTDTQPREVSGTGVRGERTQTEEGHLPENPGCVPASGSTETTDTTEQHSSPADLLRPERGAEGGTVGERPTGGPEASTAPAGSDAQPEGGISANLPGDNDEKGPGTEGQPSIGSGDSAAK